MVLIITISKEDALANGFTHEGTLYGVPAWFENVDSDAPVAAPKFYWLTPYTMLADKIYELASYIFAMDIVAPIHIHNKIKK